MNTTTLTAPHGERRCYLRGCRRPECTAANYRYMSKLRLDNYRGHERRVDSQPAADHVRKLLNAGWSYRQIADAAGTGHRTISDLARNRYPRIRANTASRVLAVPTTPPPSPTGYTNPTGTMRRIRALVAIGHPIARIATEVGINHWALGRIARGELGQIRANTAQSVAATYRNMIRKPGPSQRARNLATSNGWQGPLAWDDTTIDDPNAQPDSDNPPEPELKRDELAAERRDEIWLLGTARIDPEEIAARVGISKRTAEGVLTELRTGKRRDRKQKAVAA